MEKYRRIENSSALSKMYTNTAWYEESKKKDSIKKERPKHLAKKKIPLSAREYNWNRSKTAE